MTEKVAEDRRERFPFREIVEPRFQHVLHVIGIGRDDVPEDMDVDRLGRRITQEVRVPVAKIWELFGPA